MRHCGWLLNRFGIGHDGKTLSERAKEKPYKGKICELFEIFLWKDIDKNEHKFEERFNVGVWGRQGHAGG